MTGFPASPKRILSNSLPHKQRPATAMSGTMKSRDEAVLLRRPQSSLGGVEASQVDPAENRVPPKLSKKDAVSKIEQWYTNTRHRMMLKSASAVKPVDSTIAQVPEVPDEKPKDAVASQPSISDNTIFVNVSPKSSDSSKPKDSTDARVLRIMSFLKNVENDALLVSNPKGSSTNADSVPIDGDHGFGSVKAKLVGQQLEIEEKTRTMLLLKKELRRVKEQNDTLVVNHQKELKSKLGLQRKEYEAIIKRHLSFIDKIISEKDELSKRCENLVEECKAVEKQFKEKLALQEEAHARELKQKKELWESSEKIKREKWIQERSRAIKEQTIKGLEPEIQRMIAQHKAQLKRQEEQYKKDLANERDLLGDQHQRQLDQMREKIAGERRRAAEEERDFARQRYQKQLERDEMEFQQQKRRLIASYEEQKEKIVAELKAEKAEEEKSWRKIVDDLKLQVEKRAVDKEEATERLTRQHKSELNRLEERLTIEREEWQAQLISKMEAEQQMRERNLRQKLIEERDAEIELVIQRLETETNMSSNDLSRQHRAEVERLRSDHLLEVKQLKDQSNMAVDKILELQRRLSEADDKSRNFEKDRLRLEHEVASKDTVIKQQKHEITRLSSDEQSLCDMIRRDFELSLKRKDEEISSLKCQLQSFEDVTDKVRASYETQLCQVQDQKHQELTMVEEQVRQALSLKDQTIEDLKNRLEASEIKFTQLELVLERQRKELLQ